MRQKQQSGNFCPLTGAGNSRAGSAEIRLSQTVALDLTPDGRPRNTKYVGRLGLVPFGGLERLDKPFPFDLFKVVRRYPLRQLPERPGHDVVRHVVRLEYPPRQAMQAYSKALLNSRTFPGQG